VKANKRTAAISIIVIIIVVVAGSVFYVTTRRNTSTGQAQSGAAFLESNAGEDGVVQTSSGLQYRVINEGDGAHPAASDTVRVHYRGTLTDGTQFDSSYDSGEPVTFLLSEVIPGWVEGIQLMSVGSHYEFYIPPQLGYGEQGYPGVIPPNAVLIFEVELLGIE
jgi:FKBP-type peptidyl-prolyl cis-trans isomerase